MRGWRRIRHSKIGPGLTICARMPMKERYGVSFNQFQRVFGPDFTIVYEP
jgi:hypothetical protein